MCKCPIRVSGTVMQQQIPDVWERILLAVSCSCWGRGKGVSLKAAERGHLTMVALKKLGKNKQVIWIGECILAANDFTRDSDANVLKKRSLLAIDVVLGDKWSFLWAGVSPWIEEWHKKKSEQIICLPRYLYSSFLSDKSQILFNMYGNPEKAIVGFKRNQQFLRACPALNPYLIRLLIHLCKGQFIAESGTAGTASESETTSELCASVMWVGSDLNF